MHLIYLLADTLLPLLLGYIYIILPDHQIIRQSLR